MRKRTQSREIALKILYAFDVSKDDVRECLDRYWVFDDPADPKVKQFVKYLVSGVSDNQNSIDETISRFATNWDINRMATIDRNILRMATFELMFAGDIPPKVAINEAIDIAKKYGDKDSSKFVNGILDKIKSSIDK